MAAEPSSSGEDSSVGSVCVIAGLGNPGVRYEATPHNAGFWVVDELAHRHLIRVTKNENGTLTGSGKIRDRDVILMKPQTFMNNSGVGISAALRYRNLGPESLLVVHDEFDLPWSALRIRTNSSAAGHNGVKSIIAALKTNVFTRVRVGVRPSHEVNDAADYLLAPLEREMRDQMVEVVSYTADAVETIVAEGAVQAMAKFNRRARGSKEEDE